MRLQERFPNKPARSERRAQISPSPPFASPFPILCTRLRRMHSSGACYAMKRRSQAQRIPADLLNPTLDHSSVSSAGVGSVLPPGLSYEASPPGVALPSC